MTPPKEMTTTQFLNYCAAIGLRSMSDCDIERQEKGIIIVEEFVGQGQTIQCDHCEELFPEAEVVNASLEDPRFHLCHDCADKLRDF